MEALKLLAVGIGMGIEHLKEGPRGLPRHMYDCCGIAVGSLREAIRRYETKGG